LIVPNSEVSALVLAGGNICRVKDKKIQSGFVAEQLKVWVPPKNFFA